MEKIHTEEFFFHTYDQIMKELHSQDAYRNVYEEIEQLEKEYPIIEQCFYGEKLEVNQPVTKDELQAIQRYIRLKRELESLIEREHYIRGHRDCLLYLLRCGVIGRDRIESDGML